MFIDILSRLINMSILRLLIMDAKERSEPPKRGSQWMGCCYY